MVWAAISEKGKSEIGSLERNLTARGLNEMLATIYYHSLKESTEEKMISPIFNYIMGQLILLLRLRISFLFCIKDIASLTMMMI